MVIVMYCNQCGAQLPDDAKFCQNCGNAVTASLEREKKKPIKMPAETAKTGSGMNIKKLLIPAAVIVLILIAVMGMGGEKDEVVDVIPDPLYYYGIDGETDDITKTEKRITISSDKENLWNQTASYINLLKSGLYPYETHDEALDGGTYTWYFTYNGSAELQDDTKTLFKVKYQADDRLGKAATVKFEFYNLKDFELSSSQQYSNTAEEFGTPPFLEAYYNPAPAVTVPSSSTSATVQDRDDEDDSRSSTPSYNRDLYKTKPICGVCDGDGDCNTCSGDGYLQSSASGKEDRNCYSCNGSGNCRSCGGDGRL